MPVVNHGAQVLKRLQKYPLALLMMLVGLWATENLTSWMEARGLNELWRLLPEVAEWLSTLTNLLWFQPALWFVAGVTIGTYGYRFLFRRETNRIVTAASSDVQPSVNGSPIDNPELHVLHAAIWAATRSPWGAYWRTQVQTAGMDEIAYISRALDVVAHIMGEAALAGSLSFKGRPKDGIEFEPISKYTWQLIAFSVGHSDASIWKLTIVPRHNVEPDRVARALSYDSVIVNGAQLKDVFTKMGSGIANSS